MKRLNNKGYMLVEIILSFALAMTVMYFLMELTIKLKNKNDDLVVRTLAATDQAIIYNTIMKDIYTNNTDNYCDKLSIDSFNKKVIYDGFINIVSDYVQLGSMVCNYSSVELDRGDVQINIFIKIPMAVKQMPNENFDVVINYVKKTDYY